MEDNHILRYTLWIPFRKIIWRGFVEQRTPATLFASSVFANIWHFGDVESWIFAIPSEQMSSVCRPMAGRSHFLHSLSSLRCSPNKIFFLGPLGWSHANECHIPPSDILTVTGNSLVELRCELFWSPIKPLLPLVQLLFVLHIHPF